MAFQEDKHVTRLESNYMHQYDAYVDRQKRKKKRLVRRLVLFLVLFVIAIGTLTGYHMNQRALYEEKSTQYEQLESKMTKLENEEQNLQEEIDLLNNKDYVLDIARTNYFLSNKDEVIFKVPEEEPDY